ncbi:MAG: hypothetical protein Q7P63_06640 [Verrucomicrobiota bacterium JB022]|nr:hypothetical protein [Verrucomicrobiota bacterium JB022]
MPSVPTPRWLQRNPRLTILLFPVYVVAIVAAGALLGAILHLGFGLIFTERTAGFLLRKGLFNGAFYAFIWSIGLSFVICIVQAHEAKRTASPGEKTDSASH